MANSLVVPNVETAFPDRSRAAPFERRAAVHKFGEIEYLFPSLEEYLPRSTGICGSTLRRAGTAIGGNESGEDVDELIRLSGSQGQPRRFKVLQQWEGVISEVLGDSVLADLIDLTDPQKPREIAEIPFEEIPDADHELLIPGGVFYWTIGYDMTPGGEKSRVSLIRVRRNPKWSQHAIETIKARGRERFQRFNTQERQTKS